MLACLLEQAVYRGAAVAGFDEFGLHEREALGPGGRFGELLGAGVVVAHGLGDLREVTHSFGGHHLADRRGVSDVHRGEHAGTDGQAEFGQLIAQVLVERGDAVVVERGRAGAEHRHVGRLLAECFAVTHELAAHVAQGVLSPATFELVDRHRVGEVEHVDLFQL